MDNGASSYRRYLEGDKEGIAEIVREFKDGLILYLNGYVDNLYTAEDLTEDTFFKLMTRKPRFSGRSSFKTWLYTIGTWSSTGRTRAISSTRTFGKSGKWRSTDRCGSSPRITGLSFGLPILRIFRTERPVPF